ncbi:peptide MFS transporter [Niveibacterium sp. 24ML]|uniref:peptide MFS transporter n=1 Tax=Niveibacterium sp. 24ML TaxID=2985512 RepID=UPI0022715F7C|nr:peptide MFS transporter [Niveibacterium sp. 24ML]MCX9155364.1 peptide MFS transporter [Niveibacterium sp. 24ML]
MSSHLHPAVPDADEFERHPPGLKVIFFTEMWERFSYYGMRALLVLYLVNALHYERKDALELYGIYTGLVYLTPLLGGYLADKYLGMRQGAVIGGLIMMLGHFAMAFEPLLHLALGLLILGNGFFKPNTSSMVGKLYREHDPRRDGGYTIFYMGINLGAFFSPLIAGTLGEKVGWHWGFGSAGVGMAIGVFVLLRWQHLLGDAGLRPGQTTIDRRDWTTILTITAASVPFVYLVMGVWSMVSGFVAPLPLLGKLALGFAVIGLALWVPTQFGAKDPHAKPLTREDRDAVLAICIVVFFVIFFWMGFEQAGGTMNLFADQQTDRHAFGFEIPASWFQSINPLVIVLLAPVFSVMWTRLDRSRFALPVTAKQALGMIVLGLGFIVLAIAQGRAEEFGTVGPHWLFIVYFLHTIGELMLSPVGLSMVSKLAPARFGGLLMGVWLLSSAVANYLSGILEHMLQDSGIPLYWFLVGSSIGAGLVLLALTPMLKKLMHGRD